MKGGSKKYRAWVLVLTAVSLIAVFTCCFGEVILENLRFRGRFSLSEQGIPNRSIRYFGAVVDQKDRPIPGVRIAVRIQKRKTFSSKILDPFTYETSQIFTDDNGRFAITGERGEMFTLTFDAPGCRTDRPEIRYYTSSEGGPPAGNSQLNPEVLHFWRVQRPEELLPVFGGRWMSPEGGEVGVTMEWQKALSAASPKSDIIIQISRLESDSEPKYSVKMTAPTGGFAEPNSPAGLYLAPDSGYQQNMSMTFSSSAPNGLVKRFYLKSRNGGLYARLRLVIRYSGGLNPQLDVEISGSANPRASRNLEGRTLAD